MTPAFAPFRLWRATHLQTVTAALPSRLRRRAPLLDESFSLLHADGSRIVCDAVWQEGRAPLALVIHGVGGSSRDAYVVRAARAFAQAGFHTLSVNQKGSGLSSGLSRHRLYHAGFTDDVDLVLEHVARDPRVDDVVLCGFSLGGHIALRYAALSERVHERVKAVVAVSAPVDITACARHFSHGFGAHRVYEHLMVRGLVHHARALVDSEGDGFTLKAKTLDSIKTMRAFDVHVTAPLNGFLDATDYYESVSVAPLLSNIRVPTLLLHAEDDPVVLYSSLKPHVDKLSSSTQLVVTKHGGHVGFVDDVRGLFEGGYAVRLALAFFRESMGRG